MKEPERHRPEPSHDRTFLFRGFAGEYIPYYPGYRYKEGAEALVVYNTKEDLEARANGYDEICAGMMANKELINWFWDLEDLSAKQLRVYAQEEFGVNLPEEATQEMLFNAVLELGRFAPQNRDRIVLMAHTIKMNYDETLAEIERMIDGPAGTITEHEYTEFTM